MKHDEIVTEAFREVQEALDRANEILDNVPFTVGAPKGNTGLNDHVVHITERSFLTIVGSMSSNYNKATALVEAIKVRKREIAQEHPLEVDIMAEQDRKRRVLIAEQQMYDRHTMRDANVIAAISAAVTAGLVSVY